MGCKINNFNFTTPSLILPRNKVAGEKIEEAKNKNGENYMKKGFTLIELLVVVLIIGILAAIAVPQYQLAVMKSKVAQVVSAVSSIAQAQEVYYLTNGHYTNNMANLDIDVKFPDDWELILLDSSGYSKIEARYLGNGKINYGDFTLNYYYKNSIYYAHPGLTYCYAKKQNDFAVKLCKSIGVREGSSDNNSVIFIL